MRPQEPWEPPPGLPAPVKPWEPPAKPATDSASYTEACQRAAAAPFGPTVTVSYWEAQLRARPAWSTAELIRAHEIDFTRTKNPVFVWAALRKVLGSGLPMPAWVMAYLYQASTGIDEMSHSSTPEGKIAPAVYRALGFNPVRKNNPFRAMAKRNHDYFIAADEMLAKIVAGEKLEGVMAEVVEKHPTVCGTVCGHRIAGSHPKCETISRSQIARIWKEHGPRLLAVVDAMRRRGLHNLK